jgi:hypothetical protein
METHLADLMEYVIKLDLEFSIGATIDKSSFEHGGSCVHHNMENVVVWRLDQNKWIWNVRRQRTNSFQSE